MGSSGRILWRLVRPAAAAIFLSSASSPAPAPAQPAQAAPDCAFAPAHADPDGRRLRREASRVTVALALSHGTVTGTTFHPVTRKLRVSYVDAEIFGKMNADRVTPAPLASDSEFLRRVTLDLTGRIPEADVVVAFLADPSADKRSRMIDTLLASDAFVDRWTFFYDELFQNTAWTDLGQIWAQGRDAWHAYFQDAVRSRKPWDAMAREVIGATGVNTANGAANYVVRWLQRNGPIQDTYDNLAASTARIFLGTSAVFCTSCHNGQGHLDAINLWGSTVKRQDFWGLAAFYAHATAPRSGTTSADYYFTVGESASGNYKLDTTTGNKTDRTAAYYTTSPPGLTSIDPAYLRTPLAPAGGAPAAGEGFRQALGRLVTSDPQFARAAVNYLWKEMFGVGIVEPADGFDPMRQDPSVQLPPSWSIQPTHPSLLNRLAADYAAHGYDLRYILGVMAKSSAYQLSSFYPGTWNDAYAPYFARHFARRMMAEEVYDAFRSATNLIAPVLSIGNGTLYSWAMQVPDVKGMPDTSEGGRFLNAFLRGNREGVARSSQFSIEQALLMMNDTLVVDLSNARVSFLWASYQQHPTPTQVVTALYLRTLSRYPSTAELAAGVAMLSSPPNGENDYSVAQDIQVALLNTLEFLFY